MLFFILCIILIVFLLTINFYKYVTMWRYIEILPGPKTIPFLGNAHQIGSSPTEYIRNLLKWWKEYNYNIYRLWIGNEPFVIISNPEDAESVLSSNTLLQKADVYDLLRPWLGDGLLTSSGTKWHKHRKMITPSFHFKILVDFLEVMNENAIRFVEKLNEKSNGKIFDIQEMIHYCTLDTICETAMGTNLHSMDNPKSDVVTAFQDMCYTIQISAFNPIKRNPITFKLTSDYRVQKKALEILKNFTLQVIEKRREALIKLEKIDNNDKNDGDDVLVKQKKAFLDNLLTATIDGCPLTPTEIFEEVSTFMFEGHDTTTSGIAFAVYLLSRHQDVQENVYEEQKRIFGNELLTVKPTYQEIQEMKYLDLVIKETQRMYPSVPIIGRYCNEKFNLNGRIIPKNSTITLLIMAMGYNEKYFKDPYKFDVNRFDPGKREKVNPFEYVPFSAGPRNCIGQKFAILEMKSVLSKLVRHFEILPPVDDISNDENKNYDPILAAALTLKSENGVQIRLRKREKL